MIASYSPLRKLPKTFDHSAASDKSWLGSRHKSNSIMFTGMPLPLHMVLRQDPLSVFLSGPANKYNTENGNGGVGGQAKIVLMTAQVEK